MTNQKRKIWQIEDFDEETRREVKAYAAINGLSIAEALKAIIAEWKANR